MRKIIYNVQSFSSRVVKNLLQKINGNEFREKAAQRL